MTAAQGPAYSPVVLQARETAFETTGVTHGQRHETSEPVRARVVGIVEASTAYTGHHFEQAGPK
jgi:hypothetical protein